MPKMKPHKGSAKRFKITGTGKVMMRRVGKSHLMSHKPGSRRMRLRRRLIVQGRMSQRIRRALCVE
ncbi:MAG: 50S ribosomal protein L35 [Phycisphaerales bacterium]|nr:50S ribosomal protein L35 [Phycisphaerales bacterium]